MQVNDEKQLISYILKKYFKKKVNKALPHLIRNFRGSLEK